MSGRWAPRLSPIGVRPLYLFYHRMILWMFKLNMITTWNWAWAGEWRTSGLGPERALRLLDPGLPCDTLERIGPMWWYVVWSAAALSSGVGGVNWRPLKSGSDPVLLARDGIWMPESCSAVGWILQFAHTSDWLINQSITKGPIRHCLTKLSNVVQDKPEIKMHIIFTRDSCTGRYCWERVLALSRTVKNFGITTWHKV